MTQLQDTAPRSRASGWRRVTAATITVLVLALVFLRILPQIADYGAALALIAGMSPAAVAGLVAIVALHAVAYAWPLQIAVRGLGYRVAFVARQTAFLIAGVVPAGGPLSLGAQYVVLARAGVAPATATAAISVTGLWNLVITLLLPAAGAGVLLLGRGVPSGWLVPIAVCSGVTLALVAVTVAALRSRTVAQRVGRHVDRAAQRIAAVLRRPVAPRAGDRLEALRDATVTVVRDRAALLTLSSAAVPLLQLVMLVLAVRALPVPALPVPVGVADVFAAFALVRLVTVVPLTPNGLGTVDAGLAALLTAFGAPGAHALAAVLVWRVATTLPQVLLGTVTFLYSLRAHRRPHTTR